MFSPSNPLIRAFLRSVTHNIPLLANPEQLRDLDILVIESTYGNRLHANVSNARADLRDAILPVLQRGGKVLIPCFAFERTQEIIYHLSHLRAAGELPRVPIYVDSPMATAITRVFESNPDFLDDEARALMDRDGSLLTPDWIAFAESVDESKAITASREPSIVIAASGMCENGRIRHHLKHGIENPLNRILLVGYQAVNTLGRRLQNGDKRVPIFGDEFTVRAEVQSLHAFSAHADKLELFRYVRDARPRHVFLVHGEQDSRDALADRLREQLPSLSVHLPSNGDTLDLATLP